jgi:hypothetical protein
LVTGAAWAAGDARVAGAITSAASRLRTVTIPNRVLRNDLSSLGHRDGVVRKSSRGG